MTAHARAPEVPDTARRHLMTLAYRQLSFPNMTVEDEVAMASVIADRDTRDDAFTALCAALRDSEHDAAAAALDVLAGRIR